MTVKNTYDNKIISPSQFWEKINLDKKKKICMAEKDKDNIFVYAIFNVFNMRGKHGRAKVQGSMNNGKITTLFCRRVGKPPMRRE